MAHKLSPAELEKKRIRDRKSQNAMRSRTKSCIQTLQLQVSAYAEREAHLLSDIARLNEENDTLRSKLGERHFASGELHFGDFMVSMNDEEDLGFLNGGLSMRGGRSIGRSPLTSNQPPYQPWEMAPVNCAPTCMSDRILNEFIVSSQQRERHDQQQPARHPDINALLNPQTGMGERRGEHLQSLSTVVSDILLAYSEIDTLPRKVAALYIIYKLLNWNIYRTKSTYDQLPPWLRPLSLQLTQPHPSWIDRIPWPNVRIYLISNPEITFDDWAGAYSSSFDVSWPYSPSLILISSGGSENGQDGVIKVSPVFEQHLGILKNWTVGEKVRMRFPEISCIIDQDSLTDWGSE